MTDGLSRLSQAGVSIWLDKLSRDMITSGELASLIGREVSGVTTNPTIFAQALSQSDSYTDQLAALATEEVGIDEAIFAITTQDVQQACDVFSPVYQRTDGVDGRVSIEVQPGFAYDTEATVKEAKALAQAVGRPNVMVKIPATEEGLDAITQATGAGINVNVTLIFSQDRYREVALAYIKGLELAHARGLEVSAIHSVASIFLSRIDTKVDAALEEVGTEQALLLRGKAAIANARLCYQIAQETFGANFVELRSHGANAQRPLWASTSTKSERYRDTLYVDSLVAPGVVNTMPPATIEAATSMQNVSNSIEGSFNEARSVLEEIASLDIDLDQIMLDLEREGIDAFTSSWEELKTTIKSGLGQ